jgi:hypothetical protein
MKFITGNRKTKNNGMAILSIPKKVLISGM